MANPARLTQPRAFHHPYNHNKKWAATIVPSFLIPCGVNDIFLIMFSISFLFCCCSKGSWIIPIRSICIFIFPFTQRVHLFLFGLRSFGCSIVFKYDKNAQLLEPDSKRRRHRIVPRGMLAHCRACYWWRSTRCKTLTPSIEGEAIRNSMAIFILTLAVLLFLTQKLRNFLYETLVVQWPPAGVYESVPTDNPFVPSSSER